MNKAQLIDAMAKKMGTNKDTAESAINAFVDTITETLQAGDSVKLIGFGTFVLKESAARKGKNPQTGEEIEIKASKTPALRIGKSYKSKFN